MADGTAHSLLGSKVLWVSIVPENGTLTTAVLPHSHR
jgi:hypothetical protein